MIHRIWGNRNRNRNCLLYKEYIYTLYIKCNYDYDYDYDFPQFDFCSNTRSRNACRSAKQRPRNPAILPLLHKIHQNAPVIAPKCAAMSSKSHQMLVRMILQHPWNILGRVKNFAIFAPKLAPEMPAGRLNSVLEIPPYCRFWTKYGTMRLAWRRNVPQ